jgi:nucleoside-diphosphate-sugar epimerase
LKEVLVTGANGFIGRALCERMIAEEWQVRGAVRSPASLLTGFEPAVVGAIGLDTDWSNALTGINTVVHLASRVHVMNDTTDDPIAEFCRVNVAGTERLARIAAKTGVRRFVYLSSVKVNGEGGPVSYTERDTPAPQDPYGISKWEAEQVLHKIAAESGLEVVIIRPPLVYGPEVKANFLRMIEVVNRDIPLPLASISNRRSLIYLGNLIDAIVACTAHPKAAGQMYLVSDGEDVSTPELIRSVAAALGKPARLFPFPPALMRLAGRLTGKSEAVERLLGSLTIDSTKIRRELNWKPPYTMNQGLKETAKWYLHKSIE